MSTRARIHILWAIVGVLAIFLAAGVALDRDVGFVAGLMVGINLVVAVEAIRELGERL